MALASIIIASRPKYLLVRDNLVQRIGCGEWTVGTLIPNEAALAQEFGVSQGTMRKALDLLESELLVERRQGRGTYVTNRHPVAVCPACKRAMEGV